LGSSSSSQPFHSENELWPAIDTAPAPGIGNVVVTARRMGDLVTAAARYGALQTTDHASRKIPQTRAIPIIGLSAYAGSEREKTIATGCDEFDAKPIEFEGLVATIRRVIANLK
jgi:CheY-like chemotaxis protein